MKLYQNSKHISKTLHKFSSKAALNQGNNDSEIIYYQRKIRNPKKESLNKEKKKKKESNKLATIGNSQPGSKVCFGFDY